MGSDAEDSNKLIGKLNWLGTTDEGLALRADQIDVDNT